MASSRAQCPWRGLRPEGSRAGVRVFRRRGACRRQRAPSPLGIEGSGKTVLFLADRTATQYDQLLASSCRLSVCLPLGPSVRLSVCDAVHCGSQGRCTGLKVVPACSSQACSYLSLETLSLWDVSFSHKLHRKNESLF